MNQISWVICIVPFSNRRSWSTKREGLHPNSQAYYILWRLSCMRAYSHTAVQASASRRSALHKVTQTCMTSTSRNLSSFIYSLRTQTTNDVVLAVPLNACLCCIWVIINYFESRSSEVATGTRAYTLKSVRSWPDWKNDFKCNHGM